MKLFVTNYRMLLSAFDVGRRIWRGGTNFYYQEEGIQYMIHREQTRLLPPNSFR